MFRQRCFNKNIRDAIRLLTHDNYVKYLDYVLIIKDNEIARKVKPADLRHNTDINRLSQLEKLPPKYELYLEAIELLSND